MNADYLTYLDSDAWKSKRVQIRKAQRRAGHKPDECFVCGTEDEPLDGHHMTYAGLGNERPRDVKFVCRYCHDRIHQDHRRKTHTLRWITFRHRHEWRMEMFA